MQEFIVARQIALFNQSSRCLHLPLAAVAVAIAAVASSILFPSSIAAAVSIPAVVGLASAIIIAKRERDNENDADLIAFRNCDYPAKEDIMLYLENKIFEKDYRPKSFIRSIFSSYPSADERYFRLFFDPQNTTILKKNLISRWENRTLAREIELEKLG